MIAPEMLECQRMLDLIAFFETIANDDRTEGELTAAEQDALVAIIDGSYDRPAWWAQNLLCFAYDRCRAPLTGGEPVFRSLFFNHSPGKSETPALIVHPNPANAWVAIDHQLSATADEAMLVIRDVSGREVLRLDLVDATGQFVWDSRTAEPGAYTVQLINAGRAIAAEKLIVRR